MNAAELAHIYDRTHDRPRARTLGVRTRIVSAIAPLTMVAGVLWAIVQPWRITLLHPHGQGFWWLFSEAPLYVVLAGIAFRLVVAPPLLRDLAEAEDEDEQEQSR